MKKVTAVLAIILILALTSTGCGRIRGVEIDYGTSELYTKADLQDGISVIFSDVFFIYEECTLKNLTYAGDNECLKNLDKLNSKKEEYDKCMIFYSDIDIEEWNNDKEDFETVSYENTKWILLTDKNDNIWYVYEELSSLHPNGYTLHND